LTGAGLCLAALGSLVWQTAESSPGQIWVLLIMAGTAFLIEITFRLTTGRTIRLPKDENGS
jgi:hypothetical protein